MKRNNTRVGFTDIAVIGKLVGHCSGEKLLWKYRLRALTIALGVLWISSSCFKVSYISFQGAWYCITGWVCSVCYALQISKRYFDEKEVSLAVANSPSFGTGWCIAEGPTAAVKAISWPSSGVRRSRLEISLGVEASVGISVVQELRCRSWWTDCCCWVKMNLKCID